MARLIEDVLDEMFYEPPRQPVTERIFYEHRLDPYELEMTQHRSDFKAWLKRRMANVIAEHIIEKCQLFQMPEIRDLQRGVPIRMELLINDRGTYENWIPHERDAARRDGFKSGAESVKKSVPYGFELEQYYE